MPSSTSPRTASAWPSAGVDRAGRRAARLASGNRRCATTPTVRRRPARLVRFAHELPRPPPRTPSPTSCDRSSWSTITRWRSGAATSPSSSAGPTTAPPARPSLPRVLREIADRADATPATTTADRNLVEAVAFSARSDATLLGTHATLTAINPSEGLVAAMLVFLPRYPLVTADHGARYHAKLRAFPDFVAVWCERLRAAAAAGVVPIRHLVERQLRLLDDALAAPLSAGPLGAQRPPTELDEADAEAWTATLRSLLDTDVARGARDPARHHRRSHAAGSPAGRSARARAPRRRCGGVRQATVGVHQPRPDGRAGAPDRARPGRTARGGVPADRRAGARDDEPGRDLRPASRRSRAALPRCRHARGGRDACPRAGDRRHGAVVREGAGRGVHREPDHARRPRVLLAALQGGHQGRCILLQRRRSHRVGHLPARVGDVPRRRSRPPLPDRPCPGAARPAPDPGGVPGRRIQRGVGPVHGAPGRRDGPVQLRARPDRHALGRFDARLSPRGRYRDACARLDSRPGHRRTSSTTLR